MNIPHIDSSSLGGYFASRQLSAAAEPIPHLSGGYLAALQKAEADRTPEPRADIALAAAAIAQAETKSATPAA